MDLYERSSPWIVLVLFSWVVFNGLYALKIWFKSEPDSAISQPGTRASTPFSAVPFDFTRFHLMGEVQTVLASKPKIVDHQRVFKQFSLQGIVAKTASDNTQGIAFIRLPNGEEYAFKPGDVLVPGVKLRAIRKDQVILEQNGQQGAISLPKEPLVFNPVEPLAQVFIPK